MGEPRQYRPGSRRKRFRETNQGQYTDSRYAWVTTVLGQMILMYYPDPMTENQKEPGPTARLLFPQRGARTVTLDLTHLTLPELDALKEFMVLVDTTIRPLIEERDRIANDALTAGDDSYSRSYRQLPQFVVRQRPEPSNRQGIHDGSEDVSAGDEDGRGGDGGPDSGVRGVGGELADDEQGEG